MSCRFLALGLLGLTLVSPCMSQSRHRVVVDLGTAGTLAQADALGNVKNLKKAFGNDPVEVLIVCYGPSIDLLLTHNNPLSKQVLELHKNGVAFAACSNTLRARNIKKDRIFPFAVVVDAGIAEVVRREEAGWSYLRR